MSGLKAILTIINHQKRTKKILLAVVVVVLIFCSCVKSSRATHLMNQFKNKNEIIKQMVSKSAFRYVL